MQDVGQLEFAVLSSGSKANSLYIGSDTTRILIDCGLSAREVGRRLSAVGRDLECLDAVLLSHEHSDHLRGLPVLLKKRPIPLYANTATKQASRQVLCDLKEEQIREFDSSESFFIGDLCIEPFRVSHDAADPVMFRVSCGETAIAIATDLGHVTSAVSVMIRDVDALILETNHDISMLLEGPYPWPLKQRIRGREGHLSNEDAGRALQSLVEYQRLQPSRRKLQHVVGAHISETNNTPDKAYSCLGAAWSLVGEEYTPEFSVASAFAASPLHRCRGPQHLQGIASLPMSESELESEPVRFAVL